MSLGARAPEAAAFRRLQAVQDVDLLGGLALGFKLGQGLDRARLDTSETVQLENAAQLVEDVHLDDAALGEPFGGNLTGTCEP